MRTVSTAASMLLLVLLAMGEAQAQQTMVELGMDAGIERVNPSDGGFGTEDLTIIGIPAQWVRIGIYVQDVVSIEPRIGVTRVSSESGSQLQARLPVALIYHIRPSPEGVEFFLEGVGGVDFIRESSRQTETESSFQFRVGGGAGIIAPITDQFAFRATGEYHKSFETDELFGADRIILTGGFSVFLSR